MGTHKCKGKKSKYKYVYGIQPDGDRWYWQLRLKGVSNKCYDTEREAALVVDKYLISKGKEPVNILVRK